MNMDDASTDCRTGFGYCWQESNRQDRAHWSQAEANACPWHVEIEKRHLGMNLSPGYPLVQFLSLPILIPDFDASPY